MQQLLTRFGLPLLNKRTLLYLGGAALALLVLIGIVGGLVQAIQHKGSPANYAAVVATATTKPQTRHQIASDIVRRSITGDMFADQVQAWSVQSDDAKRALVVTVTLKAAPDIHAAQIEMQSIAYDVMRGLFQSGKMSINDVYVAFRGPLVDKDGHESTGSYGYADLKYSTAQHFAWDILAPDAAWSAYDDQVLRQK